MGFGEDLSCSAGCRSTRCGRPTCRRGARRDRDLHVAHPDHRAIGLGGQAARARGSTEPIPAAGGHRRQRARSAAPTRPPGSRPACRSLCRSPSRSPIGPLVVARFAPCPPHSSAGRSRRGCSARPPRAGDRRGRARPGSDRVERCEATPRSEQVLAQDRKPLAAGTPEVGARMVSAAVTASSSISPIDATTRRRRPARRALRRPQVGHVRKDSVAYGSSER